ncbi:FxSxx-COOH system tetratricopeptide repeat protein [Frankia sp. R82]|uniref:FxSxx-COOH system tetratricopeptide repeat protein n=1 Tax=Frankia sp. R82 TaxID=2950553 RepID=UPI0020440351|nr:FxSxx-COOH system tetratricopeptide repeat protein [Frankia sp. R82]MCM3882065.1 FxSxx-COOH system tetratricopeptide repeat protein [Frankia sp. R82]
MASELEPDPVQEKSSDISLSWGRNVPVIWGNVPPRNKNFTGRADLLVELRRRLGSGDLDVTAVLPHALQGMGGVGKTHLAIEYAYQYQNEYDLVWWIPADQHLLVRSHLAALAGRLGLMQPSPLRVEDAAAAVLDALRRGEPYRRWLLIFDNADQPETVRSLMPHGPGHVLVTSRNRQWQGLVDALEVDVFARQESLEFLRRRVPGISTVDADQLAEELGDLPLALEQAGALQFEAGMEVSEYLDLLRTESGKVLAENRPMDYPAPVAAAWSLSVSRLKEQAPFALELLRRCAFLGPEPISLEILDRGKYILDSEFGTAMRDRLLVSRAMRELGRYALARIDPSRKTVQVHRLVQKMIGNDLSDEERRRLRAEVHQLLIAADPDDPGDPEKWPHFAKLLPHIVPSEVYTAHSVPGRQLLEHIVGYLFAVGDFTTGLAEADRALARWMADSGSHNPDVLVLQGIKADILWALGRYEEAYELRRPTLDAITDVLDADHEETLVILNGHSADLRARGDFQGARDLDEDSLDRHRRVFGDDNRTFNAANNLAIDYSMTSAYEAALELCQQTLTERRNLFGRDDHWWVAFQVAALARCERQAGQYLKAVSTAEQAYLIYLDLVGRQVLPQDHVHVLLQAKDLSVARRKAGRFTEALDLAEVVYARYTDSRQFGAGHPDTLAAGINLGNAQRVAGDAQEAADRIEKTVQRYREVLGPDHPFTYGCDLNLALIHRQLGRVEEAQQLLKHALSGLERRLGSGHHYTLTCVTNLATVRASLGATDEALVMGEGALQSFRDLLGPDHPHTLVCATNLALDMAATGHDEKAQVLTDETMRRYRRVLGESHPDVLAGLRGERLDFDFEPPPL